MFLSHIPQDPAAEAVKSQIPGLLQEPEMEFSVQVTQLTRPRANFHMNLIFPNGQDPFAYLGPVRAEQLMEFMLNVANKQAPSAGTVGKQYQSCMKKLERAVQAGDVSVTQSSITNRPTGGLLTLVDRLLKKELLG